MTDPPNTPDEMSVWPQGKKEKDKNWELESRLRRCALCNYIYEYDSERIRHIRSSHPGVCLYCNLMIHHSKIEHIILRHPGRCPFCEWSEMYSSYSDNAKHMQLFHPHKK